MGIPPQLLIMISILQSFILLYALTASSQASPGHFQRKVSSENMCEGTLDVKTYLFMNKVCEDCFALYRDEDLYSACRSGCFTSSYFQGCMSSLMVDNNTRGKAAAFLQARFGGGQFGYDPVSK